MYIPKPIDVTNIELSEDIENLAELLAENTHEIWAEQRIADGWKWGFLRDDIKKETPCLVPYKQLLDIEKQYDRETSLQTLKVLQSLGYRINKN